LRLPDQSLRPPVGLDQVSSHRLKKGLILNELEHLRVDKRGIKKLERFAFERFLKFFLFLFESFVAGAVCTYADAKADISRANARRHKNRSAIRLMFFSRPNNHILQFPKAAATIAAAASVSFMGNRPHFCAPKT
jgi:hypothetical protein